jgi:hypothetical protein
MVVVLAAMLTAGVTDETTLILIGEDVAEVGEAHVSEEVITQVTTSPLFNELLVKVGLLLPEFVPLTFH